MKSKMIVTVVKILLITHRPKSGFKSLTNHSFKYKMSGLMLSNNARNLTFLETDCYP